jgi:nucleotide-binding universal stress UspA family protein
MFETVVIATDGSESAQRTVTVALDLADRFEATVHALYVVDKSDVSGSPAELRDEMEAALTDEGETALTAIADRTDDEVVTAIRDGLPAIEICRYVDQVDADVVATGTRGRHGEHAFLLGSVAEAVVRRCPIPVLTLRQLDPDEEEPRPTPA